MSRLLGRPNETWSLTRCVDALADAARSAGAPSWLWLAGLFYPGLGLKVGEAGEYVLSVMSGAVVPEAAPRSALEPLATLGFMMLILILVGFRLVTGLAYVSQPETWEALAGPNRRSPRLGQAWQAGKGLTRSALGLWLVLLILLAGSSLFLLGPLAALNEIASVDFLDFPGFFLAGPLIGILACYGLLLSVLYQLALHSLVQNRRGAASAIVHAWRLVRNDPWAAGRATLVDFALTISTVVLVTALMMMCLFPLALCISGFAGATRAGFWARNYRALGGLAPADEVPGLSVVG